MKFFGLGSSLLLAGALALLPTAAQANTVFMSGGLLGPGVTTTFVGTNSADVSQGFTAKVVSQVYAPGSGAYASDFTSGSVLATDYIYAYLITDLLESPANGIIDFFSAKSGADVHAVGFDHSAGGVAPTLAAFSNSVGNPSNIVYQFNNPLSLSAPNSTVVIFAAAGPPVFQPGSLSDGASASSLIVSATGPNLIGQPLPLPTAAFAGAGLLGVLSMGRRRRTKTA